LVRAGRGFAVQLARCEPGALPRALCVRFAVRFFPHEVADIEPALRLLRAQDRNDHDSWETRCVRADTQQPPQTATRADAGTHACAALSYGLLLWMSMVVLIPFDLKTIDSSLAETKAVA
jgi:hypothetical protein